MSPIRGSNASCVMNMMPGRRLAEAEVVDLDDVELVERERPEEAPVERDDFGRDPGQLLHRALVLERVGRDADRDAVADLLVRSRTFRRGRPRTGSDGPPASRGRCTRSPAPRRSVAARRERHEGRRHASRPRGTCRPARRGTAAETRTRRRAPSSCPRPAGSGSRPRSRSAASAGDRPAPARRSRDDDLVAAVVELERAGRPRRSPRGSSRRGSRGSTRMRRTTCPTRSRRSAAIGAPTGTNVSATVSFASLPAVAVRLEVHGRQEEPRRRRIARRPGRPADARAPPARGTCAARGRAIRSRGGSSAPRTGGRRGRARRRGLPCRRPSPPTRAAPPAR